MPEPLVGVEDPSLRVGVLLPWVKFPVRVSVPLMVTVPLLLLVRVLPEAGVTVPPKVILLAPARDSSAEKAASLVPALKVVPLIVMPPAKLVAGFWPERSKTPPELMVTAPVKVLVPVAAVAVLMVPVTEVVPVTVKV